MGSTQGADCIENGPRGKGLDGNDEHGGVSIVLDTLGTPRTKDLPPVPPKDLPPVPPKGLPPVSPIPFTTLSPPDS